MATGCAIITMKIKKIQIKGVKRFLSEYDGPEKDRCHDGCFFKEELF
jgi:hypothetical protein